MKNCAIICSLFLSFSSTVLAQTQPPPRMAVPHTLPPATPAAPSRDVVGVTTTGALVSAPPVLEKCVGPQVYVNPGEIFTLTCNVVSPLGGVEMLVVPSMWVPGNGCIATVEAPRVIMVGNNFGVTAKFTNRCGTPFMGSQGGLAWIIYRIQ